MPRWSKPGMQPDCKVRCYVCKEWLPISQVTADLDGPAFEAYYCDPCKAKVR